MNICYKNDYAIFGNKKTDIPCAVAYAKQRGEYWFGEVPDGYAEPDEVYEAICADLSFSIYHYHTLVRLILKETGEIVFTDEGNYVHITRSGKVEKFVLEDFLDETEYDGIVYNYPRGPLGMALYPRGFREFGDGDIVIKDGKPYELYIPFDSVNYEIAERLPKYLPRPSIIEAINYVISRLGEFGAERIIRNSMILMGAEDFDHDRFAALISNGRIDTVAEILLNTFYNMPKEREKYAEDLYFISSIL